MLIAELTTSGAIPVLEATLRFAGGRQRLIAHNIANATTPDYRTRDVDPAHFAQTLRTAVTERRSHTGGAHGELRMKSSRELQFGQNGTVELRPRDPSGNILFHDRNDRDMEKLMQANAENVAVYRVSAELLRTRYDLLRSAISERA